MVIVGFMASPFLLGMLSPRSKKEIDAFLCPRSKLEQAQNISPWTKNHYLEKWDQEKVKLDKVQKILEEKNAEINRHVQSRDRVISQEQQVRSLQQELNTAGQRLADAQNQLGTSRIKVAEQIATIGQLEGQKAESERNYRASQEQLQEEKRLIELVRHEKQATQNALEQRIGGLTEEFSAKERSLKENIDQGFQFCLHKDGVIAELSAQKAQLESQQSELAKFYAEAKVDLAQFQKLLVTQMQISTDRESQLRSVGQQLSDVQNRLAATYAKVSELTESVEQLSALKAQNERQYQDCYELLRVEKSLVELLSNEKRVAHGLIEHISAQRNEANDALAMKEKAYAELLRQAAASAELIAELALSCASQGKQSERLQNAHERIKSLFALFAASKVTGWEAVFVETLKEELK